VKYRSKLEKRVAALLSGKGFKYEDNRLPYISHHKYVTDFSKGRLLFEVKGRLRPGEAKKYKDFRACNPEYTLIFLFQDPNKAMPGARVRKKCGTKQTHADWAIKNNFQYVQVTDNLLKDLGL